MGEQALHLYRKLLRTVAETFGKDASTIRAARTEIRTYFQKHRNETDPGVVSRYLAEGEEANEFLKTQVVQGMLNSAGDFEMDANKAHLVAEEATPKQ